MNKQITEDYVSEEVAKLLQMKGFDEPCDSYYEWVESGVTLYKGYMPEFYHGRYKPVSDMLHLKMPTIQMALKWLREVHNVFILSDLDVYSNLYFSTVYTQLQCANPDKYYSTDLYKKPEQAIEAAILYVLKNLI